jgi:dethiobiotin synthetase
VPIHGVAFVGDDEAAPQETIAGLGSVRALGRLPRLDPLTKDGLRAAFDSSFTRADFQ